MAGPGVDAAGSRGMPFEAHLRHLERDLATVEAAVRGAGERLTAAVPACPGWDLRELVTHLGRIHRWATQALESTDAPRMGPRPGQDLSADALADWFADGGCRLVEQLRSADPARPCWTFSGDEPGSPATVLWWARRQAHETSMHRWDVQSALGVPDGIDPVLAGDGLDEVASMFYPRQVELGRRKPLATPVRLRATDVPAAVVLGPDGGSADGGSSDGGSSDGGSSDGGSSDDTEVAEVAGPAELLLLLLWHRADLDDLIGRAKVHVQGDHAAARSELAQAQTP